MASSISFSGAQKVLATSELSYGERTSRSSPEVRNSPPIKLPHSRTSTDATRLSMVPPYLSKLTLGISYSWRRSASADPEPHCSTRSWNLLSELAAGGDTFLIDSQVRDFHVRFRLFHGRKTEFLIQPSIPRDHDPAAQPSEVWMAQDTSHQPFPKPFSPIALQDVVVTKIGEGSAVRNHSRESNLLLTLIDSKAQRPSNGPGYDFLRYRFGFPIRLGEKGMDAIHIQPGMICADQKLLLVVFANFRLRPCSCLTNHVDLQQACPPNCNTSEAKDGGDRLVGPLLL